MKDHRNRKPMKLYLYTNPLKLLLLLEVKEIVGFPTKLQRLTKRAKINQKKYDK